MKTNSYSSVYEYLVKTIQNTGYPPTVDEIATDCGFSERHVIQSLNQLERDGRIRQFPHKLRGIRISELDWRWYCEDQITHFIQTYVRDRQAKPSVLEVAKACGLHPAVVCEVLSRQLSEGVIQSMSDRSLLATA